jgi:putative transposase
MPRETKFSLIAIPQHLVQRGNDRSPCFFAEEDYVRYLKCLTKAARSHGCRIHAYVLLPDHVHLLGTPRTRKGFAGMMQTVRDQYAEYVKHTYQRTVGLCAGRHQTSLVQPNNTLLDCYRYIELHPVRSGLAQHPATYRWSSHGHHALGMADDLVTEHSQYRQLGDRPTDRYQAYRELLRQPLDARVIDSIRKATAIEGVLGDAFFLRQIAARLKRRVLPTQQDTVKADKNGDAAARPVLRGGHR